MHRVIFGLAGLLVVTGVSWVWSGSGQVLNERGWSSVIAGSSLVAGGVVAWPQALVMIPGVAIGGWSGVWVAKRVPQTVMRAIVIAVGLFLAAYYFVTG